MEIKRDNKGRFIKGSGGGPKKTWDKDRYITLERLCERQYTIEEICYTMHVSYDTLNRLCREHYNGLTASEVKEKYKGSGRGKIRDMQWKACEKGSIPMLMWFGKNYLGQKENPETNKGIEEIKNNIQDLTEMLKNPQENRDINNLD